MTTILTINTIIFGALGLIWKASDGFNLLVKLALGTMFVVNGIQLFMALGFIVRA
jgi:hypothetical protein